MGIGNIILFVIGFFILGILCATLFFINNTDKLKKHRKGTSLYFLGVMFFFIVLSGFYLIGTFLEIGNPKELYWMLVFLFSVAGIGHVFYASRLYQGEQMTTLTLVTLTVFLCAFGTSLFTIFGAIFLGLVESEMNYAGVFDSSVFWFLLPMVCSITYRYFDSIPAPIHVGFMMHKAKPPPLAHGARRIPVLLKIKAGRKTETFKINPPDYFKLHEVLHSFFIEKQKSGEFDEDSILSTLEEQRPEREALWLFYKKEAWWKRRCYLPRNSRIRDLDRNAAIEKAYEQQTKVNPGMRRLMGKTGAPLPHAEAPQVRKEDMHGTEKTQPVLFAIKVSNPVLGKTAPALAAQTG